MIINRHLILVSCLFLVSGLVNGQNLCQPGAQLQSIVSGRGSTIATHMPSIVYNANTNQFTVTIFNNNEILSAAQCSNLNGPNFNNPGTSTFSISLTCDGPENNGLGVSGGIAIPISNSTQTLSSVVIATGNFYSNIPVKLFNGGSLANRNCQLTLQGTLYQILANDNCYPCVNFPIATVQIATGPPGFSGNCCWTCLTCYSDNNILWTSTFMWIFIFIGSALVVAGICLIWFSFAKQAKWNALMAKFLYNDAHKMKKGNIDPREYERYRQSLKEPGSQLYRPHFTPATSETAPRTAPLIKIAPAAGKKRSGGPSAPRYATKDVMPDYSHPSGPTHGEYSLVPTHSSNSEGYPPNKPSKSAFHSRPVYDHTQI